MIKCKICGKPQKSVRGLSQHIRRQHNISIKEYYDTYLKKPNEGICPTCGKQTPFLNMNKGYKKHCDNKCSNRDPEKIKKQKEIINNKVKENPNYFKECHEKSKKTRLERYGDENYGDFRSESFNQKMIERHGDKNYNNREKCKQTCLEKYGVKNNLLIDNVSERNKRIWENKKDEILEKRKKTSLKKYGVESPNQSLKVQQKIVESRHRRVKEIEKKYNCTLQRTLIQKYGQGWMTLDLPRITFDNLSYVFIDNKYIKDIEAYIAEGFHTNNYISKGEKEIVEFLNSIGITNIIENATNIVPNNNHRFYELDIWLPDYNIAIEYNGDYYHSTKFKDKNYHIRKLDACNKLGIRLINIFEYDWLYKKDIIKSILKSIFNKSEHKIYARNCIFKEISQKEYKEFLEINHLQGAVNSKLKYGLFYNSMLVQVIGFGKSRFKENEVELHRMCTKLDYSIIGGFSKLLKNSNISNCISYVDRSLYDGSGYFACGFVYVNITPPSYYYIGKLGKLSRFQCQKHKLSKILDNFNENLSEKDNMFNNKYLQIYDCGNLKLKWERENELEKN